eukprot:COSAG04_NODE_567_length_12551_cov_8.279553_3_plen_145_part_00
MLSTIIVHLSCIFIHDATAKVACLIAPATSSACFPQSKVSALPFLSDRTSSFCFFFLLPICQTDVSLKQVLLVAKAGGVAHELVLYLLDRVSRHRLLRLVVLSDDQPGAVDHKRYLCTARVRENRPFPAHERLCAAPSSSPFCT